MSRVYTVSELESLGYVQSSPGVFKKLPDPNKKPKKRRGKFANVKRGYYAIDEDKILYFRSEWEYFYACYLEKLLKEDKIKGWEYEPKAFHFKQSESGKRHRASYIPDFKITENDGSHWWAEVKGYLTPKGKAQLNRMSKEYPEEEVRLITRKGIIEVRDNLGLSPSPQLI